MNFSSHKNWINRILNIGIDDVADSTLSLSTLRKRIVNMLYCFVLFITANLFIVRLLRQEMYFALINVGILLIVGGSFYLCFKKKHIAAFILILHYFVVLAIIYAPQNLDTSIGIYLSLVPSLSVFVLSKNIYRYYYGILCFTIYTSLFWGQWSDVISYTALYFAGFCTSFSINNLLEKIYQDLELSNNEKAKALELLNNRNEELVLYSNMMAHDLKAPIRGIEGFARILERKLDNEELKEYLDFIISNSHGASKLIENLLSYSKANQLEVPSTLVDLNTLIEEQKRQFLPKIKQARIIFEVAELPKVQGDHNSLQTVFHNLLSNALKFQPKNNTAHIPRIIIECIDREDCNIIYVFDNGIGIEEDYVKDLFTPFKKQHAASKYKGSGLGMSICKKVMEKHGGDIQLHTTDNTGSCFKLVFPKTEMALVA